MPVFGVKSSLNNQDPRQYGRPTEHDYKTRCVTKCYSQIKGIDFNELFRVVPLKATIWAFLGLGNLGLRGAPEARATVSESTMTREG
jgi:hypothetical protein